MARLNKQERALMAKILKYGAEIAGTIPCTNGEIVFEVEKITINGEEKGLLFVRNDYGERLPVLSPHYKGEPENMWDYIKQRDCGIIFARQHGISYGEKNLDLIDEVLEARNQIESINKL